MAEFLKKFIFSRKRPTIILLGSNDFFNRSLYFEKKLGSFLKIAKISSSQPSLREILRSRVLIFNPEKIEEIDFFIKNSSQSLLLLFSSSEEKTQKAKILAQKFKEGSILIECSDDNFQIGKTQNFKRITYGFGEDADFRISDYKILENGTTFKLSFKGKILPVWLSKGLSQEEMKEIAVLFCLGWIFSLNLVKIAQSL